MNAHQKYPAAKVALALTETKGMITLAAKRLGCAPNTVRRYVREYAACRQALEDARAEMGDTAELKLYKAVTDGEPWAITFYLKTLGKDRGYTERQEVTGKDGGALAAPVEVHVYLPDNGRGDRLPGAGGV